MCRLISLPMFAPICPLQPAMLMLHSVTLMRLSRGHRVPDSFGDAAVRGDSVDDVSAALSNGLQQLTKEIERVNERAAEAAAQEKKNDMGCCPWSCSADRGVVDRSGAQARNPELRGRINRFRSVHRRGRRGCRPLR